MTADYISVIYDQKIRPQTNYPSQLARHLVKKFAIPSQAKLLDAGCGRGDFLKAFFKIGLKVYGIEYSADAISKLTDYSVLSANLEKDPLPFTDNYFDVIFAKSVLEHLFNPENFIKEAWRTLKPNGRIILLVPDWISQMKIYFDDYTHRQPYTVNGVNNLLKIFNFQQVSAELFYQLPVLWQYPWLKAISKLLQLLIPVTTKSSIKFIRWSIELMILGTGLKPNTD